MPHVPRFSKAADNTRPYNSHRYDVFAPKLNRTLTLFGRTSLDAWTVLESDPDVECYCERPLVIPDTKPKRVIDFWVKRRKHDEFLFLLRPSELPDGLDDALRIPAFQTWAKSNNVDLKFVDPADLGEQKFLLTNWGWIIRDLSAFGRFLPPSLSGDVEKAVQSPISLEYLERHFFDVDPVLVRVAVFSLLHRGHAVCRALNSTFLDPSTVIEPA